MEYERFRELLAKHLDGGELSPAERTEFQQALQDVPITIQDEIADDLLARRTKMITWNSSDKARVYQRIQSIMKDADTSNPARVSRLARFSNAALWLCMVGLAATAWYVRSEFGKSNTAELTAQSTIAEDIDLLADTEPILKMPDGRQLSVHQSATDSLQRLGIQIRRDERGTYYEIQKVDKLASSGETPLYAFQTPKGTTSRIRLADGTEVVLNSHSILRYPSTFSGNERRVILEGEAYFDVAHRANQPFIVAIAETEIKVLGTTFNVSAYTEDKTITTTLLSGKVQFKRGQQHFTLLPGEQSISTPSQFTKQTVAVQGYVMWMDGFFFFENQSIASILETVKRWYDLDEITFQTRSEERFSGTFKRSKSLQELLSNLERLGQTRYKIQGRRVVVMK